MASSNSSRLARRRARTGGNRPRTHPASRPRSTSKPRPAKPAKRRRRGVSRHPALSEAHEAAIEVERRNLQQVHAVLGCLITALEYGDEREGGYNRPDFSDAVLAARRMVHAAMTALDPISLAESVARMDESDE